MRQRWSSWFSKAADSVQDKNIAPLGVSRMWLPKDFALQYYTTTLKWAPIACYMHTYKLMISKQVEV